ncbi:MAG: M3 family metallopeptidase [Pseudomonadota bacterium]
MVRRHVGLVFLLITFLGTSFAAERARWNDKPKEEPIPSSVWVLSGPQLDAVCKKIVTDADTSFSKLVARRDKRTFANSVRPFESILAEVDRKFGPVYLLADVAVDESVRKAGDTCRTLVSQYLVGIATRPDLYGVIKEVDKSPEKSSLTGEDARLLEKIVKDFERNGLQLPEAERKKYEALRKDEAALQQQMNTRVREDKSSVLIPADSLKGLPSEKYKFMTKEGEAYRVPANLPNADVFLSTVIDPEARRLFYVAYQNRGGDENMRIVRDLLRVRREAARLVGQGNPARFSLQDSMAKDPVRAVKFLEDLSAGLTEKLKADLSTFLELKQREEPATTDLAEWDRFYYPQKVLLTKYVVNPESLRAYFPLDRVKDGMFKIYETLYGVRYVERRDLSVWSDGVSAYEVREKADNKLVGYFYVDIGYREGKRQGAASYGIRAGRYLPDGKYQVPVDVIVAGYQPDPESGKILLRPGQRGEVETLFHEFGHAMHTLFGQTRYTYFAGTNVPRDFVEAPSTMSEHWVWDENMFINLSGHYKTGEKIPVEEARKLLATAKANTGILYARQLLYALFSLKAHMPNKYGVYRDPLELWAELSAGVYGIPMAPGTHPVGSFTHLAGYGPAYYSYLWDEAISDDLFTRFQKAGLLSETEGMRYRQMILEPGGSIDPDQLVADFMGRPLPSPDELPFSVNPFLAKLGLSN